MHSVLQNGLMTSLVAVFIHSACWLQFLIPEDKHTATWARLRQHWCALICVFTGTVDSFSPCHLYLSIFLSLDI